MPRRLSLLKSPTQSSSLPRWHCAGSRAEMSDQRRRQEPLSPASPGHYCGDRRPFFTLLSTLRTAALPSEHRTEERRVFLGSEVWWRWRVFYYFSSPLCPSGTDQKMRSRSDAWSSVCRMQVEEGRARPWSEVRQRRSDKITMGRIAANTGSNVLLRRKFGCLIMILSQAPELPSE